MTIINQISGLRATLLTFSFRFTRDKEEANDLVQDTILKAISKGHRFTENVNLKGWLFMIMKNTFVNSYRKNQRKVKTTDPINDSMQRTIADYDILNQPDRVLEYDELLRHMNGLSSEILMPFRMHTSGYKYREIADELNLPIGTVKNRIFKARQSLQQTLSA